MTDVRILVTGARGYLGGRLVRHLREATPFALRLASRAAAPGDHRAETISVGGLDDDALLDAACDGVTHIIHLAALNEIDSEREPERAVEVNINGTVRLARAATKAGVRRMIFLSTAHVYGAPLMGIIDETRATRPTHPYAITHRAAEDFVFAAAARSPMEPVVLRLSNAIGAPADPSVQRWTLLVNDLCRQAVTTGRLTLRSAGLARRDFIAMADACRAMAHFVTAPSSALGDGLFNLGGGRGGSMRVADMVDLVVERCERVLGFRPEVVRPAPAPGESSADLEYRIDRLRTAGFEPAGDLEREIDDTLRLCVAAFGRPPAASVGGGAAG